MKKRLYAIVFTAILGMSLFAGCGRDSKKANREFFITKEIPSAQIADNNLMGDPGAETIYIYLPPDYYDSKESYPVVYYLHGFGESAGSFLRGSKTDLDSLFADGKNTFIMVEISGNGYTGGSFYVNSPSSGNWENCLINEIIPYVDKEYRTLAQAGSRGICGFSMGGFGAMNLALRHPDVFAAVYSMSPGIMKDDALPEAVRLWSSDKSFLKAYARAFSPNPEIAGVFGDIPSMDGTDADNLIAARWLAGFGNWSQKLDAYLSLKKPLSAIGICYGTKDGYPWITEGCAYFADLLRENGMEPTVFTFDGGHFIPTGAISDHLGPFFRNNLIWE